jgi:hypothetical protein
MRVTNSTRQIHVTTRIYIYYSHHRHRAAACLRPPLHGLIPLGHFRESTMSIIVLPAKGRVQVFIALSSCTIPLILS